MQAIDGIFYVVVLIMSVVIHEVSHGYAAYRLGDQTARLSGRLTLNPLKHLDPFGSVLLPGLLLLMNAGFVVGWARPVPYNPNNFRNFKKGTIIVAFAGIAANILIALIFSLLLRIATTSGLPPTHPFFKIGSIIVLVNLILALFNLIPIPPLDGSKILFPLLPRQFIPLQNFLDRWGMFVLLFFIIFLWSRVAPLVFIAYSFLTGLH